MAEVQGKRKHLSIEEQESIIRAYYLEGASKNSLVKKYQSSFTAVLRVIRNFAAFGSCPLFFTPFYEHMVSVLKVVFPIEPFCRLA